MRILFEWLWGIGLIATLYFLSNIFQIEFLDIFNNTPLMAVFYVPAAVRVFSAIIFGYWAGLGIAAGAMAQTLLTVASPPGTHEIMMNTLQQGGGVSLSLLVWAYASSKVTCLSNPQIDFARINAFDVLQMCMIQAVINSLTAHLFFLWAPSLDFHFDFYNFFVMLVGDLTGAFFIFILANIAFSLLKRTPLFPRQHYDDIMNK